MQTILIAGVTAILIVVGLVSYFSYFSYDQIGITSWSGEKLQGHKTSSGEPYDMYQMTAAHKTLPLGTIVRVVGLKILQRPSASAP